MSRTSKGVIYLGQLIVLTVLYALLAVLPGFCIINVILVVAFHLKMPLVWLCMPLPFPILVLILLRIAHIEPLWHADIQRRVITMAAFITFLVTAFSIYELVLAIYEWFNPVLPLLPDNSGINQPESRAYIWGWFGGISGGFLVLLLGYLHSLLKSPKSNNELPPA